MNDSLKTLVASPDDVTEAKPRIRLFTFGAEGTWKTRTALTIADAVGGETLVYDPEAGTDYYRKQFSFALLKRDDRIGFEQTIRALAQGGHPYRTLILDPISLLWDAWLEQWEDEFLSMRRTRAGHHGTWYEMDPGDWAPVKRTWRRIMRMITKALDMNVIATARAKDMYSRGKRPQKVGETFSSEKDTGYWFATTLHFTQSESGKRYARTIKDRSGRMPPQGPAWEFTPEMLAETLGAAELGGDVQQTLAEEASLQAVRDLAAKLDITTADLNRGAHKYYGAASIEELSPEQAKDMLERLESQTERTESDES